MSNLFLSSNFIIASFSDGRFSLKTTLLVEKQTRKKFAKCDNTSKLKRKEETAGERDG